MEKIRVLMEGKIAAIKENENGKYLILAGISHEKTIDGSVKEVSIGYRVYIDPEIADKKFLKKNVKIVADVNQINGNYKCENIEIVGE